MEQQIAQYFLWSVYVHATTLLIIVGLFGWFFRHIQRETREISQAVNNVAAMTRDVAMMTSEILRRTER